MSPTKLLYLEDLRLLKISVVILEVLKGNGKDVLVLDQTVFYPQGGGQPYDQGMIESANGKFLVEEVRLVDGIVKHIGKFEQGAFAKDQTVTCSVDQDRRQLHSRIHSAGHVVDLALKRLQLNWAPTKGYHFPEGPYVEYAVTLENFDREKLKKDLEDSCNALIGEGRETTVRLMNKEEMKNVCAFVPDYIPPDRPARVVFYGDFGIPCGGTHVSNLSEIGKMTIRKIKGESGKVRVAYDVAR